MPGARTNLRHSGRRRPAFHLNMDLVDMRKLLMVVATMVIAAVVATPARAEFGVQSFDGMVTANPSGDPFTQAGGHPFSAWSSIEFNTHLDPDYATFRLPDGDPRDIHVDLPSGLVGNPTVAPTCTLAEFFGGESASACPPATQVGVANVKTSLGLPSNPVSIYTMVPQPGTVAAFGFMFSGVPVFLTARVRSDTDYGLSIDSEGINQGLQLTGTSVELWGTPADPVHDAQRCRLISPATNRCDGTPGDPEGGPNRAGIPLRPFLTNPTACTPAGVGLRTDMQMDSWQAPGQVVRAHFVSHLPPAAPAPPAEWGPPQGAEGCEALPFDPSLSVTPSTHAADAPTGLSVHLAFPQDGLDNPNGLATAHLKTAKVTLPEGMTINPAGAGGLAACSDQELGLGTTDQLACPESSKVGIATASTPLLSVPLTGGVYIRSQASADPESGDMFRIALVLQNKDRGLDIRLPGQIKVNRATGRIETIFDNNPQLPVDDIDLSFKVGPRAPLATPPTCGEKTVDVRLTSWSGKTVDRQWKFTIDCTTGLGGFAPSFAAGTATTTAGAFSPFNLAIAKPDGNADINGLSMTLPPGLVAQLNGNLNTQVGTVKAFAGPGTSPFMLPGQVFLEGPYGDAPFSLRVVVPAKAGPFDLGTVTVRQKIYVDPHDAHVTVVSDPLPTIVSGVPVRLQRLDVNVDKPGFIINPTSCAPMTVSGVLSAGDGQTAAVSNRFQVGECTALDYAPKLAMSLSGKGQTKDGAHPTLTAHLATNAGDANSKKVTVTLPLSLALDVDNANGLCEPKDAATNSCPAASIVGHAKAQSILPDPLQAPVYFVRGERKDAKTGRIIKTLPKLFIPLTADGVTVNLNASSDVVGDRLVTTFDTLPDAPFSSFDLTIDGGKHGILAVSSSNVCAASQVANGQFVGQNGKAFSPAITMTTQCTFGIQASRHTATALKLTISGLGAGKVAVSGKGFTKTSRTIGSATVATLSAPLTTATRQALAHHRNVKVKVSVAFTPKGTKKAKRVTKVLTIHAAKARR